MATACDVLVVGGGTGGVTAAVAAARAGVRVLLVERYGFLGGSMTAGLVNPFMSYRSQGKPIIEGIFAELLGRLRAHGGLAENGSVFDDEVMKFVLDEMVLEAKVQLLLHSWLADVSVEGKRICQAHFETKSGRDNIEARVFIDGTGDGDLAARAGAEVEVGRPSDGLCQSMTLCFRMAKVDTTRMPTRADISKLFVKAKAQGKLDVPRQDVLFFATMQPDVVHFNTTRVIKKSAINAKELSEAEVEGRRQVWQMARFLKDEVPGFENAYLNKSAMQIGVRESRRIMGDYVLTEEDIVSARKFDDGVCRGNYGIDIHSPTGEGTVLRQVPAGMSYEIPYRAITPRGVDNLLVASRCISATHEAHSAIRVIPIVMAIGQAAGLAAALALQEGKLPREISHQVLREALLDEGANLEREPEVIS